MAERFLAGSLPGDDPQLLAAMDTAIAHGGENRVTDTVERIARRRPPPLSRFASESRGAWRRTRTRSGADGPAPSSIRASRPCGEGAPSPPATLGLGTWAMRCHEDVSILRDHPPT